MKKWRFWIWSTVALIVFFLGSFSVTWATPEQNPFNQTIPTRTPIISEIPGGGTPTPTPTATPIILLPPSGGSAQGNATFILPCVVLAGGVLVFLLSRSFGQRTNRAK